MGVMCQRSCVSVKVVESVRGWGQGSGVKVIDWGRGGAQRLGSGVKVRCKGSGLRLEIRGQGLGSGVKARG